MKKKVLTHKNGKNIYLRTMMPLIVIWSGLITLFLSFQNVMFMNGWKSAIDERIAVSVEVIRNSYLNGIPLAELDEIPMPFGYELMSQGTPFAACILFDENGREILHNNIIKVEETAEGVFGYIDSEKIKEDYLEQLNKLMNQDYPDIEIYLDTFKMDNYEIYPEKMTVYSQNKWLGSLEIPQDFVLENMQEYKDMKQKYKVAGKDLDAVHGIQFLSDNLAQARSLSCYKNMKSVEADNNYSKFRRNHLTEYETGKVGKYRYLIYLSWDKTADMRTAGMIVAVPTFLIFAAAGVIIAHQFKKIYKEQLELETYRKETTDALAHDLKTPLAVISGNAQNLQENVQNNKREHYAGTILEEISLMDGTIQKMLKISRLEKREEDFIMADVDLLAISQTCAQRFGDILTAKQMKIHIQGLGHITADEEWMQSIIENLISNAVNYGKEGTAILIVIGSDSYEVINICQDKLDLDKLWRPYVKSDSSRKDRCSTGLGLAIIKRAAEVHGFQTIGKQIGDEVKFGFIF